MWVKDSDVGMGLGLLFYDFASLLLCNFFIVEYIEREAIVLYFVYIERAFFYTLYI